MNLGLAIQRLRKEAGFSQTKFAKACNITQTYLSLIENNVKEPNLSTLRKVAEKLHIPLPVMFFMALDENDVQKEKRSAYNLLAPSIHSMIAEFFSIHPSSA